VPWQVVSSVQQSTRPPQPSEWPQPMLPKSAHVFGWHGTHALFWQKSLDWQV
jgi:hypothetical protein